MTRGAARCCASRFGAIIAEIESDNRVMRDRISQATEASKEG
jgi:hypothetical protein